MVSYYRYRLDHWPVVKQGNSGEAMSDTAMIETSEHQQEMPPLFLDAWKDAIHLAGVGYFNVATASVGQATDINQLPPNLPRVFDSVGALSTYEQVFLIALCQFYCDSDTRTYCEDAGVVMPSLVDIANLEADRLNVVTRLMESYTGW